ncbi:MAG: hypothetical protein M1831_003447 [Alyxoria varia]|nr:MAG: hypothetical protein M1831_003447 [Alyxoria varia]
MIEEQYQYSTGPTFTEAAALLVTVLDEIYSATIFIDGVDELSASDQVSLLETLKRLTRRQQRRKVWLSSRHGQTTTHEVFQDPYRIDVTEQALCNDLRHFVQNSVRSKVRAGDLVLGEPTLEQKIITTLENKAKDMFLWVALQLEILCEVRSDFEIRKVLIDLPKDLGETYRRILQRVNDSTDGDRKMQQLEHAIALGPGDSWFRFDKTSNDYGTRILKDCGGLVRISEISKTVTLAHHSVQQFLFDHKNVSGSLPTSLSAPQVEIEVAELMITYLLLNDFDHQIAPLLPLAPELSGEQTIQAAFTLTPSTRSIHRLYNRLRGWVSPALPMRDQHFDVNLCKSCEPQSRVRDNFDEKYPLLKYAKAYWAQHSKALYNTDMHSTLWEKFHRLALEREAFFEFRPWRSNNSTRLDHEESECGLMLEWALQEGHVPLIRLLQRSTHNADVSIRYYGIESVLLAYQRRTIDVARHLLHCIGGKGSLKYDPAVLLCAAAQNSPQMFVAAVEDTANVFPSQSSTIITAFSNAVSHQNVPASSNIVLACCCTRFAPPAPSLNLNSRLDTPHILRELRKAPESFIAELTQSLLEFSLIDESWEAIPFCLQWALKIDSSQMASITLEYRPSMKMVEQCLELAIRQGCEKVVDKLSGYASGRRSINCSIQHLRTAATKRHIPILLAIFRHAQIDDWLDTAPDLETAKAMVRNYVDCPAPSQFDELKQVLQQKTWPSQPVLKDLHDAVGHMLLAICRCPSLKPGISVLSNAELLRSIIEAYWATFDEKEVNELVRQPLIECIRNVQPEMVDVLLEYAPVL